MASLDYHFRTTSKFFIVIFIGSILISFIQAAFYRVSQVNLSSPLNYSDIGSIYTSVTPMDLYFNNIVESTGESTSDFIETIVGAAGSDSFTLNA